MSPPTVRSHETARRRFSAIAEDSDAKKESSNAAMSPNNKDCTSPADASPATSRYGRAIKPKTPTNSEGDSPKTGKMPKLRKSGQLSPSVTEKSNGIVRKAKDESNDAAKDAAVADASMEDDKAMPENETIKETPECEFSVGQLAWAVIGNYPYWPCVVTLDPVEQVHAKLRSVRKTFFRLVVHVQYFGDRGRHGWVSKNAMIPFTGLEDFHKLAKASSADAKKKNVKNTGFVVRPQVSAKWGIAVDEATEVLPMTNAERAEHFKPKEEPKSKYEKLLELATRVKANGKRERWSDAAGPNPKRMKREDAAEDADEEPEKKKSQKIATDVDHKISINNLNTETPPTPPSSHKDSSDESSVIKKAKVKKRKKDLDGDFELYYERNRDMMEDAQPDATEAEIRIYLEKTWENMTLTLRGKYRSRIKPANGVPVKEGSTDHEEESSVDSDSKYSKKPPKSKIVEKEETSKHRPRAKSANGIQSKEGSTDHEEESSVDSDSKYNTKSTKSKEKTETRGSDSAKKTRPYNLFRGTKQERVCQICERTGDLTRCKGPCYSYFHLTCVKPGESSSECSMDEETNDNSLFRDLKEIPESNENEDDDKNDEILEDETFKCIDCLSGVAPACFICNEREEDRVRCSVIACGRHYHPLCLKLWPQSHWQGGRLTCPYHVCHTCISDNPQNGHSRVTSEKLVRCVRCPSSYHPSTSCLPAGSEILTGSQVICPKHYKAPGPPINATWCFLCTRGGSLICCDTCPTSFHPECLGIDAPDGAFICEDCETGRMPLYGEVVWVKLGSYRWWPSRICFPYEIPRNLEAISHCPGEFCVMFLGTNNYYWVHRGRAFLYQDGDANGKVSIGKRNVDEAYKKALEEANEIYQRLKIERSAAKGSESRFLKPPPYVKLKVNKPVGNVKPIEVDSIVACECDANWDNPCSPDTDCLNRILSVECSPGICPAGPKCNNQAFVRRQYPSMEPFHTKGRGWGLRALEPITDGQFVIEYVGEVIDEAEYKRRLEHKKEQKNENFYFLTIDTWRMIDAEPKGNLSRFMNHSCQPNCETQKWTVNGDTRIGLFALRDIEVGEELTFNYNLACDGETRKPCLCGAPNCSGFIGLKVQKQQLSVVQQSKIDTAEKVKVQRRPRKNCLTCGKALTDSEECSKCDQKTKSDAAEKVKSQERNILSCWSCSKELADSDDCVKCDQRTCSKSYHRSCVTVEEKNSKFICPWHHCKECSRRTGVHCNYCSAAYCQAHLEGKLFEYKEKGGYACKAHEELDGRKSVAEVEVKEDSETEMETDKEASSTIPESPTSTTSEKQQQPLPRESSPRVSIVEVQFSSEEGEDSQKEDSMNLDESFDGAKERKSARTSSEKSSERVSGRKKRREGRIKTLRSLTPSQLELIIGGSIIKDS